MSHHALLEVELEGLSSVVTGRLTNNREWVRENDWVSVSEIYQALLCGAVTDIASGARWQWQWQWPARWQMADTRVVVRGGGGERETRSVHLLYSTLLISYRPVSTYRFFLSFQSAWICCVSTQPSRIESSSNLILMGSNKWELWIYSIYNDVSKVEEIIWQIIIK